MSKIEKTEDFITRQCRETFTFMMLTFKYGFTSEKHTVSELSWRS